MSRFKRILVRICLAVVILVPVAAFAHYIIFPQETRSILIDYSDFKKDGRISFNSATSQNKVDSLKSLIEEANLRNKNFWGEIKSNSKFIYCEKQEDFKKYCANSNAPAVTYLKLGSFIVLSKDGLNLDIIAHEISHAEFYERIGFYKFNYKIPAWFKHGLAMQNDYRNYYSEDTLSAKTNNFKNIPNIKLFNTDAQFYNGTQEQVMLNYMAAKHEVKNWYTKQKLDKLINDLNAGKSFDKAYNN